MKRIFDYLKQENHPNCSSLGTELEVSARTIQRDLEVMRDQLGLPIEYVPEEHGYALTQPVHEFPTVQVTEGELLALMVAQKAIEQYRGTPYHAQLETAFDKILSPLKEMVGYAPSDDLISFKVAAPAIHEVETFDCLSRAVADCLEVTFHYHKPGQRESMERNVQPLHLTHRDGRWYLVAHDIARGALRTFALARISEVVVTDSWFERPEDFSIEGYFASALGVMNGTENHRVRIRFDPYAADHVKDRFWHDSQTIEQFDDGSLELSLVVADLLEVQRLILQWGGLAKAMEPEELRDRLRAAARQLVHAHSDGNDS